MDYDIFQILVDKYKIADEQEELKYPEYLKAYINKHNISEFIEINPQLKELLDSSEILNLKFDIQLLTSKLSRIKKLKSTVAEILGVKSRVLRLIDIEEGLVDAKFHIPAPIA